MTFRFAFRQWFPVRFIDEANIVATLPFNPGEPVRMNPITQITPESPIETTGMFLLVFPDLGFLCWIAIYPTIEKVEAMAIFHPHHLTLSGAEHFAKALTTIGIDPVG